ncbi:hypothetical protein [Cellulomonas hominis]
MSDDLGTALHRFLDSERRGAEATAPDPRQESDALARRVGRIRAVRTGSTLLVAAAVVGLVTVGVQALEGPSLAPPALPSPTSTDEPAPSTTPTAPPTGTAAPTDGATPADPDPATFRSAEPMTPGALENSGDGWHLVRYGTQSADSQVIVPTALYLVSPDGQAQVVPAAIDPQQWDLLDWLPGTALAIVNSVSAGQTTVVDLLTGTSSPPFGAWPYDAQFARDGTTDVLFAVDGKLLRIAADGSPRAESATFTVPYGTTAWSSSPDGARVVLNTTTGPRVVGASDLSAPTTIAPYPGHPEACRAWMWVDDTDLLLQCSAGGLTEFAITDPNEFWLAPADGGTPHPLAGMPDQTRLGGVWRVGDRLVAGMFGPSEAEASWWEVTADGLTPLTAGGSQSVEVVQVRGAELLLSVRQDEPDHSVGTPSLVALDPVRGTTRTLVQGDAAAFSFIEVVPATFPLAPQTSVGD